MFVKTLSKSIFLLISLTIIICIIYPGILWIIGQGIFPFQANGSILLNSDNQPIGSKLIAEPFTKNEFFKPRPSAASYDASASASSALAPSNAALRDRVARLVGAVNKWQKDNLTVPLKMIPGDFVTTSASGLDPHISLENAEFQLDQIVLTWAFDLKRPPLEIRKEIETIIASNVSAPLGGLAGEKFVNVLELNIALEDRFGSPP